MLLQHGAPEMDYVFVTSLLGGYARPRQEISRLLKRGALVRVKKGLYVAPKLGGEAYSREILANLIYGPSYVSLEYALRHHGLIPERVEEVTSVTCNRDKVFTTPVGTFSYRYLRPALFSMGFSQGEASNGRRFLIASPEKALVDKVWFSRKQINPEDLPVFLFEDLRIDPSELRRLSMANLKAILSPYSEPVLEALAEVVRQERKTK